MIKKATVCMLVMVVCLSTTACWDQLLLKSVDIMVLVGIDSSEGNQMEIATVPLLLKEKTEGEPTSDVYTANAETLGLGFARINAQTSKLFTSSKIRVIILGEKFAHAPFRQQLDAMLRDPASPLDASVIVVKGKAKDFIQKAAKKDPDIGNVLTQQIDSQHDSGIFPNVSLQHVVQRLTDIGEGTVLPTVDYKKNHPVVIGTSMLHLSQVTGELTRLESALLMLSSKVKARGASITLPAVDKQIKNRIQASKSFVSIRIREKKVKYQYHIHQNDPANIQLDVYTKVIASIREYTPGKLNSEEKINKVEEIVTSSLEKQSKEVYRKIQAANCDFFGIGRHLIAYYPEIWRKLQWEKTFPTIKIVPHFEVDLNNTGIIY